MGLIGRELAARGESLWIIDADTTGIRLLPCAGWDIVGGVNPESWVYRCDLAGPSASRFVARSADAVLHFRINTTAHTPFRGRSPLEACPTTAALAATLEERLGQELSGPVGNMLWSSGNREQANRATGNPLNKARGQTLARTQGHGSPGTPTPNAALSSIHRVGANPPQSIVELRGQLESSIFAAYGIPGTLASGAEGSGDRESARRFLHFALEPYGFSVQEEMRAKLGSEVRLSWKRLFASDLTGRARAFQSMVAAGMDPGKAAGLAGLMEQ